MWPQPTVSSSTSRITISWPRWSVRSATTRSMSSVIVSRGTKDDLSRVLADELHAGPACDPAPIRKLANGLVTRKGTEVKRALAAGRRRPRRSRPRTGRHAG